MEEVASVLSWAGRALFMLFPLMSSYPRPRLHLHRSTGGVRAKTYASTRHQDVFRESAERAIVSDDDGDAAASVIESGVDISDGIKCKKEGSPDWETGLGFSLEPKMCRLRHKHFAHE